MELQYLKLASYPQSTQTLLQYQIVVLCRRTGTSNSVQLPSFRGDTGIAAKTPPTHYALRYGTRFFCSRARSYTPGIAQRSNLVASGVGGRKGSVLLKQPLLYHPFIPSLWESSIAITIQSNHIFLSPPISNTKFSLPELSNYFCKILINNMDVSTLSIIRGLHYKVKTQCKHTANLSSF